MSTLNAPIDILLLIEWETSSRIYFYSQDRKYYIGRHNIEHNDIQPNQQTLDQVGKARGQCYKTLYVRNLRIFLISQSVCVWQALQIYSYKRSRDLSRKICKLQTEKVL